MKLKPKEESLPSGTPCLVLSSARVHPSSNGEGETDSKGFLRNSLMSSVPVVLQLNLHFDVAVQSCCDEWWILGGDCKRKR